MKKIIAVGLFMLLLIPARQVLANTDHVKPAKSNVRQTSEVLSKNELKSQQTELLKIWSEFDKTKTQSKQTTQESDKLEELKSFPASESDRQPASLADPVLLDMGYYYPYIIAAAVVKDPDNVVSQRGVDDLAPIYYYYDSRGNLDYVQDYKGTDIAWVYYCDGSEGYYCPLDWVDYIDLDPLGAHAYLEFYYYSDTPNKVYHASLSGEPYLYFYNINMADGAPVTNSSDPLYWADTPSVILVATSQITGYVSGESPYEPDYSLELDNFSNQRLTDISNFNNSISAVYYPSVSRSIYRFWSNTKQHHFFTIRKAEKNQVVNGYDDNVWRFEGVSNKAYTSQETDTLPVYRFWSDTKQGHFFTIREAEKASIIANDHSWAYEGTAWYVPTDTIYYTPE